MGEVFGAYQSIKWDFTCGWKYDPDAYIFSLSKNDFPARTENAPVCLAEAFLRKESCDDYLWSDKHRLGQTE